MIPEFIQHINLKTIRVEKNHWLVKEGRSCPYVYFIVHGCLRFSFIHHRRELTTQFFFEGDTVTLAQNFLYDKESHLSIQTVEECQLLVMDKNECNYWLQESKEFREWFYPTVLGIEANNTRHLQRFISFRSHHRIGMITRNHPEWITRVPARLLASYIGTTESTIKHQKEDEIKSREEMEIEL